MTQQCSSPFAAVSLCGVAGLAETFPSFPVSGPFLPDVPGFQVPSDSVLPPQLGYPSRALPFIFISTTARMFSVLSLLLECPNHSSLLRLITIDIGSNFASSKISSFLQCSKGAHTHCPSHHSHLSGCQDIVIGGQAPTIKYIHRTLRMRKKNCLTKFV